mmetsp:Transcript_139867/g.447321  ORF Transcript_139867/g.447321 Transcript_139867/m.447321 type:complete len:208 (+) Transcript_139867:716-1339(+)
MRSCRCRPPHPSCRTTRIVQTRRRTIASSCWATACRGLRGSSTRRHQSTRCWPSASWPRWQIKVRGARDVVRRWLLERHGHPSLWSAEEWQAINTISDALVARRANRVEFWLLRSLEEIQGRKTSVARWSAELRSSLYRRLDELWTATRLSAMTKAMSRGLATALARIASCLAPWCAATAASTTAEGKTTVATAWLRRPKQMSPGGR